MPERVADAGFRFLKVGGRGQDSDRLGQDGIRSDRTGQDRAVTGTVNRTAWREQGKGQRRESAGRLLAMTMLERQGRMAQGQGQQVRG